MRAEIKCRQFFWTISLNAAQPLHYQCVSLSSKVGEKQHILRGVSFFSNSLFFLYFPLHPNQGSFIINVACDYGGLPLFETWAWLSWHPIFYSSWPDVKNSQMRLFPWKTRGPNRIKHLKNSTIVLKVQKKIILNVQKRFLFCLNVMSVITTNNSLKWDLMTQANCHSWFRLLW